MLIERIRELCFGQSITLAELERRTEISNGTIAKWEKSEPRLGSVLKVADYFGVSLDWLTGRETKKPTSEIGSGQTDRVTLKIHKIDTISEQQKAPQSHYRLWGVSFVVLIKLTDFENILPIFAYFSQI